MEYWIEIGRLSPSLQYSNIPLLQLFYGGAFHVRHSG